MRVLRVLQCVNNMHRAGLETTLMNYYRSIDKNRIQFDFLTHRPFRSEYDDEIESLGGRMYYAPRLTPQNYPSYFAYMKEFFSEHPEYQIVHSHIDAMSFLPLLAAKKANVPIRIAHSHNTAIDLDYKYLLKQLFRKKLCTVATDCFACGYEAGRFLFDKNDAVIIPNAINADRFIYNEEIREKVRLHFGLTNDFVVGHVGRFSSQKNHGFLVDIFYEIQKIKPNATLMLIGTGENEEKIKAKVDKLEIAEKVQFLGVRADVSELYQAMDVFVLPSLFEGVPVVGIEAQFSGMPCFFSNKVPQEVAFSKNCAFCDLNLSAKEWAKKIVESNSLQREKELYLASKYRIENAAQALEQYYFDLLKERGLSI